MDFIRTIPSHPDEAQALIAEALRHFREAKSAGLVQNVEEYFFHLALDEMLSNAIRHGAPSSGPGSLVGDGEEITLTVRYSKRGVTIAVRDGGCGFAVEKVPDPRSPERMFCRGGRGVWILNTLGKVKCDGGEVKVRL